MSLSTLRWTGCLLLTTFGCAGGVRRFPLAEPLTDDPDRHPVAARPAAYYSGLYGDEADQVVLRPLSRVFRLETEHESANVNSMDEVPNSSWFHNRVGWRDVGVDEARRGSCQDGDALDPGRGPWAIIGAKPDGANPGFIIRAPGGARYLMKFDGPRQPQRATTADVVGSKLYHLFGFETPCNEIVYFNPALLVLEPGATKSIYGRRVALSPGDVEQVLQSAFRHKDGTIRASVSRFLPGVPIGPFRYEGTRADDPNDVIPHDDRRELRGGRLLAAWINHYDAREQNSLDTWVTEGERQYVRHYYLDFGDAFGCGDLSSDAWSRRNGFTGHLSFDHVLVDLVSLGAVPRPWNDVVVGPEAELFGLYSPRHFVASQWRPAYPNPAFSKMTDRDALWATRILARMDERLIRAAVAAGQLEQEHSSEYLVRTLMERRQQILMEYLTRLSPLTRFDLVQRHPPDPAQSLCFEDDAILTQVADAGSTVYRVRAYGGRQLEKLLGWFTFRPDEKHPGRSCILLPVGPHRPDELAGPGAPADDPLRYLAVEIRSSQRPSMWPSASVRAYLYDLGPDRGFQLVGVDRQDEADREP